jgi:CRISP-associated protein Cas1
MTTLYLDRSGLDLRDDQQTIVVYEGEERRQAVPIALLERVVIRGNVTLTTGLLGRLAEAGVAVALLGGRNLERAAMMLGRGRADARIRLAQYQRVHDPEWCAAWSRRIIQAKLRNQILFLEHAMQQRPDCRTPLHHALETLKGCWMRLHEEAGLLVSSIRGLEGAAAAAYFSGYASLFPASLQFTGRNRRPPRDPVNACLSLAYTLVHIEAVRSTHGTGLDPFIGFYHQPAYGRESLASDCMERLRPLVDRWVWECVRNRTVRAEDFAMDKGACLLRKAGRQRFYQAFETLARPCSRYLRRQAYVIARALAKDAGEWPKEEDDS